MRTTPMLVALIAATAAPGFAFAGTASCDRVSRTAEGYTAGSGERGSATTAELKEQRTLADAVETRPHNVALATISGESWIFDADAALFDDFDDDGYYRFLSVRLDADTYAPVKWVYAMLYLSADGRNWEHYFTTEDFSIGGTVPDDEYFVETELLAGYPPGLYDVLIELYDADYGTFEDEFGPSETSALGLLPIEDAGFDAPPIQIAVSSGGGGAMSLWLLPVLAAGSAIRRRSRRRRSD